MRGHGGVDSMLHCSVPVRQPRLAQLGAPSTAHMPCGAVQHPALLLARTFVCRRFEVRYRYNVTGGITGAAIAAPCASTHSINMGQRVIMLKVCAGRCALKGVVCAGAECTVCMHQ